MSAGFKLLLIGAVAGLHVVIGMGLAWMYSALAGQRFSWAIALTSGIGMTIWYLLHGGQAEE